MESPSEYYCQECDDVLCTLCAEEALADELPEYGDAIYDELEEGRAVGCPSPQSSIRQQQQDLCQCRISLTPPSMLYLELTHGSSRCSGIH